MDDECKAAFEKWAADNGISYNGKWGLEIAARKARQAAWELRQPVMDEDLVESVIILLRNQIGSEPDGFDFDGEAVYKLKGFDKAANSAVKIAQAPLRDELQELWQQLERAEAALQKAVDQYGKPGGPWNVPSEPGSWISMAELVLNDLCGTLECAGYPELTKKAREALKAK